MSLFGEHIGREYRVLAEDRMTNMQAPRWTLKARGLTLACAILAGTVSTSAVRAQEDVEDNLPDVVLMREILKSLGLRGDDRGIDYRERSPLVVPPTMTLPPPDTRTAAQRNPAWPVDQDVRRRREAAVARAQQKPLEDHEEGRAVLPDEMTPGRRSRLPAGSRPGPYHAENTSGSPLTPTALGYIGGLFDSVFGKDKEEQKSFAGEPPRTALIEPPAGYQTPSPKQPYGVGVRKNDVPMYDPLTMQSGSPR